MTGSWSIILSIHHPDPDIVKNAFIRVKNLADWQGVLDRFYCEPVHV